MNTPPPPRVLIFPWPVQGHVSSMLKLAEILAISAVHVTFITTDQVHSRLVSNSHVSRFCGYPGFVFRTFSYDSGSAGPSYWDFLASIKSTAKPFLRSLMASEDKFTCFIADGIFGSFPIEIGDEVRVPVIHFRTASACYFWASVCMPLIIQAGELPIRGEENKDKVLTSVAGMESFLRVRDLPSFFQLTDTTENKMVDSLVNATRESSRARGLILNTFEHLEGPSLSHIRNHCNPNTYAIGPLHAHLKERLTDKDTPISTTLIKVDNKCLAWLDSQPPKSVVYVSFGSITTITRKQLLEFWHGLVISKKRFLWVMRSDLLADKEEIQGNIPTELTDGTEDRGFIAEWVPQEEVLSHVAVGGFLTHSGWNSTLESIMAEVLMLCWPYFADQQINSRFVGEVWKIGIDMKDVCDRNVIAKLVDDLMVERKDELEKSMATMKQWAIRSVSKGGSSYSDMDRLIQDLWLMSK